ncbi:hypothetical protein C9374_000298 [Naegleria lovaniensis]|uniref:Chitin synthase export chaperone n=1 Tax=Naegleria lovaniensis TaxID=51637 RepID=A0AA88GZJ1_NAELO|nr:uncharacterized protein C9374_000298 [Naegleria lovaniensis]KAG2388859.1 hypothetical protein C9374_000298 [Naegleria lovaniensis]
MSFRNFDHHSLVYAQRSSGQKRIDFEMSQSYGHSVNDGYQRVIHSGARNVNNMETSFGAHFRNCWNMSQSMSNQLPFTRSMVTEQWIPSSFGCSNISLWTKYGVPKYWANTEVEPLFYSSFIYFDNSGESYDLCSKVGNWEKKLKLSCDEILCGSVENLSAFVQELTEKETNIFDWINYCQYCSKNNTLRSYQQKLEPTRGCFPKDKTVNEMINRFPSSLTFCGNYDFGIPLIINTSALVPNVIQNNLNFAYICYCRDNLFTFKCAGNDVQYATGQAISYGSFAIHAFSFILTFTLTFLPKLKSVIKQRKFFRFVTIAVVLFTEIILSLTFTLSAAWATNIVTTILGNTALSLVFFTLFAWVAYWVRLVLYVKTKKTTLAILLYIGFGLLWLIVGVVIPCIIGALGNSLYETAQFYAIYMGSLSLIACIIFVSTSTWIYWAMKKVSDVNMLNTSFIRFVIYSSISTLVLSSAYLIMTQVAGAFFIGVLSGSFSIVTHVSIASITLGLTYMEFEKEEFMEFYACCCHCCTNEKRDSTPPTDQHSHSNKDYSTFYGDEDPTSTSNTGNTYYSKMPINDSDD